LALAKKRARIAMAVRVFIYWEIAQNKTARLREPFI
jgi:hypothetical protein